MSDTIFVRADELKLGMVVVYGIQPLRKRIVKLSIHGGEMFPGHIRYEFDDRGCATMPPDHLMVVEIARVMVPPGEFEP